MSARADLFDQFSRVVDDCPVLDGDPGPVRRQHELLKWARDEILSLRARLAGRGGGASASPAPASAPIDLEPVLACTADAPRRWPAGATSTSHPSLPIVFRSRLYVECPDNAKSIVDDRWTAHIKVDHDQNNPLLMSRIRRFAIADISSLSNGKVKRSDVVDARVYRTKKGSHLRLFFRPDLPRLPAEVILAMQAALGDDPKRQEMNAERVAKNQPGYNVLWTQKYVNGVLIGEEKINNDLTAEVRRVFHVKLTKSIETRFWSKIAVRGPDDCWLWTGALSPAGYGHFYLGKNRKTGKKKIVLAHRFAMKLSIGRVRKQALHSCDTPACCNPRHLRDGSQSDNVQDALARGRFKPPRAERSGKTKLTWPIVRDIRKRRRDGEPVWSIADRYGLSSPGVSHIVAGHRWKEPVEESDAGASR